MALPVGRMDRLDGDVKVGEPKAADVAVRLRVEVVEPD